MSLASRHENKRPAPPYVGFSSFRALVRGFKAQVLPSRIDHSVLNNFSGVVGRQLLTALRFLKLIDQDNLPQDALRALVQAFDTDKWEPALAGVIKGAY